MSPANRRNERPKPRHDADVGSVCSTDRAPWAGTALSASPLRLPSHCIRLGAVSDRAGRVAPCNCRPAVRRSPCRRAAPWRCGSTGRRSLRRRHARRTQKIPAPPMQRQEARRTDADPRADPRPNKIQDGGAWLPPYPVRARADVAAASAAAPATKCATARRGGFIMFVPGNAEQRAGFIRP